VDVVNRDRFAAIALFALAGPLVACNWTTLDPPPPQPAACYPPLALSAVPAASMDFTHIGGGDDFFAAPFPAIGRVSGDKTGVADAVNFPAPTPVGQRLVDLVSHDGYAITAGIVFKLGGATPAPLPSFAVPDAGAGDAGAGDAGSASPPPVMLFPVEGGPPVAISAGMTTTKDNHVLLTILPVQGLTLRENTEYAAIVTTTLTEGRQAPTMTSLCAVAQPPAGTSPPALPDAGLPDSSDVAEYLAGIRAAKALHVDCANIAAMSVYRTTDPTAAMRAASALAQSDYRQKQGACSIPLDRDVDKGSFRCTKAPFCVFKGTVMMPQYQRGTPPFAPFVQWGGGWPAGAVNAPSTAPAGCDTSVGSGPPPDPNSWTPTWLKARVIVTLPHAPPPTSAGYPVMALVRAGAGTFTDPLVDRGPTLGSACTETACRGPAEFIQSVGFAGITIDGPLVGESRLQPLLGENEDLSIFNFLNPLAMRDNLRQSALELTLLPQILAQLQIDTSTCDGVPPGPVRFDFGHLVLFSHSMGASISPLALAGAPFFRAAIMSGSGGSLLENIIYKAFPVPIDAGGSLLGLPSGCTLSEFAPALSLLQWAEEPSDSEVYARRMVRDASPEGASWWSPNARHVLMIQGLVDHDILPPIADVMTLGEGLDLGLGPNSCSGSPICDQVAVYGEVASPGYPSISSLLPLSGHGYGPLASLTGNIPWPANVPRRPGVTGDLTALVVQHRIDENREFDGAGCVVNGHEVIYESTLARHQVACFLYDFEHNVTPQIRAAGEEFASCGP
jgi:hypothetical protein